MRCDKLTQIVIICSILLCFTIICYAVEYPFDDQDYDYYYKIFNVSLITGNESKFINLNVEREITATNINASEGNFTNVNVRDTLTLRDGEVNKTSELSTLYWNIDGETGLTGTYSGNYNMDLGAGDITADNFFGNISQVTGEHWWNESPDVESSDFNTTGNLKAGEGIFISPTFDVYLAKEGHYAGRFYISAGVYVDILDGFNFITAPNFAVDGSGNVFTPVVTTQSLTDGVYTCTLGSDPLSCDMGLSLLGVFIADDGTNAFYAADGTYSWRATRNALMETTSSLYFRDTDISITSDDDGVLDLHADSRIDLNANVVSSDNITANNISGTYSSFTNASVDDTLFVGDKVGIGTTNPTSELHIVDGIVNISNGDVFIYGAGTNNALRIVQGAASKGLQVIYPTVEGSLFNMNINALGYGIFASQYQMQFATNNGHITFDADATDGRYIQFVSGSHIYNDLNDVAGVDHWYLRDNNGKVVTNISSIGNMGVLGNITAENVFLLADISAHTDVTIPVTTAGDWINVTFDEDVATPVKDITHVYSDGTNDTFTIVHSGTYEIRYTVTVADSNPTPGTHVVVRLIKDGVEIDGSLLEEDSTRQYADFTIGNGPHVDLVTGDKIKLQFTASDTSVSMESHVTYGDHKDSATMKIKRIR